MYLIYVFGKAQLELKMPPKTDGIFSEIQIQKLKINAHIVENEAPDVSRFINQFCGGLPGTMARFRIDSD